MITRDCPIDAGEDRIFVSKRELKALLASGLIVFCPDPECEAAHPVVRRLPKGKQHEMYLRQWDEIDSALRRLRG